MHRDSEKQYLLSIELQPMVDTYLYLARVYLRLDQPLLAISKLQEGLAKFPYESCLVQAIARIHEVRCTREIHVKRLFFLGSQWYDTKHRTLSTSTEIR